MSLNIYSAKDYYYYLSGGFACRRLISLKGILVHTLLHIKQINFKLKKIEILIQFTFQK